MASQAREKKGEAQTMTNGFDEAQWLPRGIPRKSTSGVLARCAARAGRPKRRPPAAAERRRSD